MLQVWHLGINECLYGEFFETKGSLARAGLRLSNREAPIWIMEKTLAIACQVMLGPEKKHADATYSENGDMTSMTGVMMTPRLVAFELFINIKSPELTAVKENLEINMQQVNT